MVPLNESRNGCGDVCRGYLLRVAPHLDSWVALGGHPDRALSSKHTLMFYKVRLVPISIFDILTRSLDCLSWTHIWVETAMVTYGRVLKSGCSSFCRWQKVLLIDDNRPILPIRIFNSSQVVTCLVVPLDRLLLPLSKCQKLILGLSASIWDWFWIIHKYGLNAFFVSERELVAH